MQAEALGLAELDGGALINAEFGIGHGQHRTGRSGVALSIFGRVGHCLTCVCAEPKCREQYRVLPLPSQLQAV